jgi:hypothetical protein
MFLYIRSNLNKTPLEHIGHLRKKKKNRQDREYMQLLKSLGLGICLLNRMLSSPDERIKLVFVGGKPQFHIAESDDPRIRKEMERAREKQERDLRRQELRLMHKIEKDMNRIYFFHQEDLFWKETAKDYKYKNKVPKFKPHTKGTQRNFYRRQ